MPKLPGFSALCVAAVHFLVVNAFVARENEARYEIDIAIETVYSATEVVTRTTFVEDCPSSLPTDPITLTEVAYVVPTGLPVEYDYTVTETETFMLAGDILTNIPPATTAVVEFISQTEPTQAFAAPEATLQPAVLFNIDLNNLTNLIPCNNHDLYYTADGVADPSADHGYALLNANYSAVAVVLEHSAFVASVTCQTTALNVTFTTDAAFQVVQQSWSEPETFILVTHTFGCSEVPANDTTSRTFFKVSGVAFSGLSAIVTALEVPFEEAINEVEMSWGTYNPNTDNALPTLTDSFGQPLATPLATAVATPVPSLAPACGAPPAPFISGFPAAACGDNFDYTLDSLLGFVSFSDSSFSTTLKDVAPGLGDYQLKDYQANNIVNRGPVIEKRFFGFFRFLKKIATAAVNLVKSIPAVIKTVVKTAVAVVKVGIAVVTAVATGVINPSVDETFNIDLGPKNLVKSPFGDAYQLFQTAGKSKSGAAMGSIAGYCVGCGVTGSARVQGKMSFSILQAKLTEGSVGINGNIKAGLGFGLSAEATYSDKFTKEIISIPIGGFAIPKIVTIGPVIALDVDLEVDIKAVGELLIRAEASLPNFSAKLDLVNDKGSTQTGFKPVITTNFTVKGEIVASANLGVPLTVGVGITIPVISEGPKGRKLIAVKSRPGIKATAQYSIANKVIDQKPCNNGVALNVTVTEDTTLDFFGISKVDLYTFESPPLISTCISLSKAKATPKPRLLHRRQAGNAGSTTVIPTATVLSGVKDTNPTDAAFKSLESLAVSNNAAIAAGKNNTNGLNYTTATDSTGKYLLAAGDNGNFYVETKTAVQVDGATLFALSSNIIVTDESDRFIFYYPNTMAQFGISRLRLGNDTTFPRTADIVSLVPLDFDDSAVTPGVYVAVGTNQAANAAKTYFYPVICNYESQVSKIFLVNDVKLGVLKLADPTMRYIVTGGVVTNCSYIAFMSSFSGM
ncbi:hypothetical protein BP6252_13034 [Coleophoma cylindrospora]|uniref:Uncharacterized protein n=1 Tax=Coleophoma cylindrospora TaxID=1849047 RepID=A0A3D8QDZ1_9HELO|nr:hypothetical protein BP6252_13034 [Coleophoma cylindrospora]